MAVTIRHKGTGKLEQVTRNVAFDLIDRGLAERVYEKQAKPVKQEPTEYSMRELHTEEHKEETPTTPQTYKNRQFRTTK